MYDNARVTELTAIVGSYLREPLPGTVSDLKAALIALESLRSRLLEVRVDWQMMLAEKRSQYLMPKDKDWTELDRKTRLNAQLANIERDCEFLIGLESLIKERIDLGQLILSL